MSGVWSKRQKPHLDRRTKWSFCLVHPDDPQESDTYKGSGPTSHCRGSPKGSCFTSLSKINSYDRKDIFREKSIGKQAPLSRTQIDEENLSWRQRHRLARVVMRPHLQDVSTYEHPLGCSCCIPFQRLWLDASGGARRKFSLMIQTSPRSNRMSPLPSRTDLWTSLRVHQLHYWSWAETRCL